MNLNSATSKIPELDNIVNNVMYIPSEKWDIELNGMYRFWTQGRVKIGQHTVESGYYSGNNKTTVTVPKGSGIAFDRYPMPAKIMPEFVPVPPVTNDYTLEDRMFQHMRQMQEQLDRGLNPDVYLEEETAIFDEEPDIELNVSDMYITDEVSPLALDIDGYPTIYPKEKPPLNPEDTMESESEPENPRVGGGREAGGSNVNGNQTQNENAQSNPETELLPK